MRRWPWPKWALAAYRYDQSEDNIVSFLFGDKGLMGDVSFSGSRFKKLDVE